MSLAHEERFKNEAAVFALRAEPGVQEMRKWIYARRDEIARRWIDMAGDDLLKLQGEAKLVDRLIRMIDHGPTTRGEA